MENLVIDKKFWPGKTVFLTGHTGFKGAWMSLWLQQLGANVIGYALDPLEKINLFDLAKVAEDMIDLRGDVRNLEQLKETINRYQPQIIIHMAAQALVQNSYLDPITTYSTNIMGTVNILEAVRQSSSVKLLLNVTSDKCYENKEREWGYHENEAMGGNDPYSSSKACAELVTHAYRHSFFSPEKWNQHGKAIASARAGNVIGGGDWSKQRLIPDIISALIRRTAPVLRHPDAIRPWQHVLDCLSGYILLVQKLWERPQQFAQAWNFGPRDQDIRTVHWVTEKLIQLWGAECSWQREQKRYPHESKLLKLDITKAQSSLGWMPRLSLEQALEFVVVWYFGWQSKQDIRQLTIKQIQEYEHLEQNENQKQHAK